MKNNNTDKTNDDYFIHILKRYLDENKFRTEFVIKNVKIKNKEIVDNFIKSIGNRFITEEEYSTLKLLK